MTIRIDQAVEKRYSQAAQRHEANLCCPASYDPKYLQSIPQAVLERDYGCGDPSQYVKAGETVLDLGSGGGKICFIASQIVGPEGRVIGVDINDDMLALARGAQKSVAEKLGYSNVEFHKGRIEDLALDCEQLDQILSEQPINSESALKNMEHMVQQLRATTPLIPDNSIDVVISNCVLNLVEQSAKPQLFSEIYRVLKDGGRAVISDIVSDEVVPEALRQSPELWSDCVTGALREDDFLSALADTGLYGITLLKRDSAPWQEVEGIEFRSVTVAAYKGKEGPCRDHKQAVIYHGPFKRVEDDDNHVLERGMRMAVCEKTFRILSQEPYRQYFDFVEPNTPVLPNEAEPFPCNIPFYVRDPQVTKNGTPSPVLSASSSSDCGSGCGC